MEVVGAAAVVAGGGSGLGEATARRLARDGAKVGILDRDIAHARAVADAINGAACACDVAESASVEAALATLKSLHGSARIVVNCAGIAPAALIFGRTGVMKDSDFAQAIAVNLIGTFNVLRLAVADMVELDPLDGGERGVIINTASIAAFEGQIGQCAYAASKGGVAALTLPAARELARHGIRVVAIAPGVFATPMITSMPAPVQESLASKILFPHRLGVGDEFAALARDIIENQMLNGTTIRLDGGYRMAAN